MQLFDLKEFRVLNNLSQLEAADYFGCTQGFISQIERNIRPIPDNYMSKAIADKTKVIPLKEDPIIQKQEAQCLECIKLMAQIECMSQTIKRHEEEIKSLNRENAVLSHELDIYRHKDTG